MKFWVVASGGLVGLEMCKLLDKKKAPFVGSRRTEVDVRDPKAIEKFFVKHKPTHVFNCSAHVGVDAAEGDEAGLAFEINAQGAKNLSEIAKKHNVRLIHVSTDYVFDGKSEKDYEETDPVAPVNIYGQTKLEGEKEVMKHYPEGSVIVRTASLFGKGKPGLVSQILHNLRTKEVVQNISDQISSPTYTKDLCKALLAVRDENGIFHFVNKGHTSRLGLTEEIKKIAEELGIELKCQKIVGVKRAESGRRAVRPKRTVLSTRKIEVLLDHPIRRWQDAVKEYMTEIAS